MSALFLEINEHWIED